MKRLLSIAAVLCCVCLLSVNVAAAQYEDSENRFSVELDDSFTVLDRTNLSENKEFIEKLGSSVENFGKSMKNANIYLYAATEDNQRQVQVKVWESGFSQDIGNLAALNDSQFEAVEGKLRETVTTETDELLSAKVIDCSNTVFVNYTIRSSDSVESDTGETMSYCMSEYLTVADGRFVALIYYNSHAEFSAEETAQQKEIFDSFKVAVTQGLEDNSGYLLLFRIIAALLIAAAVVLAVIIVWTFIKDIRAKHDSPETIPDRIKMRRKK